MSGRREDSTLHGGKRGKQHKQRGVSTQLDKHSTGRGSTPYTTTTTREGPLTLVQRDASSVPLVPDSSRHFSVRTKGREDDRTREQDDNYRTNILETPPVHRHHRSCLLQCSCTYTHTRSVMSNHAFSDLAASERMPPKHVNSPR